MFEFFGSQRICVFLRPFIYKTEKLDISYIFSQKKYIANKDVLFFVSLQNYIMFIIQYIILSLK